MLSTVTLHLQALVLKSALYKDTSALTYENCFQMRNAILTSNILTSLISIDWEGSLKKDAKEE